MSVLRRALAIPSASESSRLWHVSAPVDTLAYALGWAWILAPLELFGNRRATEHLGLFFIVIGLTFAHRHYTLPYVYLDREIFERHPRRFTFFPAVMLVGFLASPYLGTSPAGSLIAAIALFAGLWNVWHIYMQK